MKAFNKVLQINMETGEHWKSQRKYENLDLAVSKRKRNETSDKKRKIWMERSDKCGTLEFDVGTSFLYI